MVMTPQQQAHLESLRLLQEAFEKSRLSLRGLARRMNFKSHAELSRILSGRKIPSPKMALALCSQLKIEGRPLRKIISELAPEFRGFLATQTTPFPVLPPRVKDTRFFHDVRAPLVFEALKILGTVDVDQLVESFHGALVMDHNHVERALTHLHSLGCVTEMDGKWHVCDAQRDTVVPSGVSLAAGYENIRFALSNVTKFIPREGARIVRSTLASVRVPPHGRPVDAVRQLLLNLQDDVLAQQSDEDDAVVQIVLSAVEVARRQA